MNLLEGKVAIITGAARGIGKAIALRFAAEGCSIAFTDLEYNEAVQATEKEIAALGVKVKGYASNAASYEDTQKVVGEIASDFGRVDILVNNAGITKDGALKRMTEAQWDAVITVNLDHWRYGEKRYRELEHQSDVHVTLCPGCTRVEKRVYEGEVTLRSDWTHVNKQEALRLIEHEEARERATNPSARIAHLVDRGDEIYLLTTTQFLAHRIGRELFKAFRGAVKEDPLPYERFTRVRWTR